MPSFDLLNCMDKMLYLGMPEVEIIRAVTAHPAMALGKPDELGTLKPGACADVAVFDIVVDDLELYDVHQNMRRAQWRFRHVLTVLDGEVWAQQPMAQPPAWININPVLKAPG
jgi:dihydroorotase